MIEAFEKKTFNSGEDIIRQGDDGSHNSVVYGFAEESVGDYYYILDSGKADVSSACIFVFELRGITSRCCWPNLWARTQSK